MNRKVCFSRKRKPASTQRADTITHGDVVNANFPQTAEIYFRSLKRR